MGIKLFEQIGRNTHRTLAGEEFYLYSQKIFALIDEALGALSRSQAGRLNLHQLFTFQVVATNNSYVRAAEELHFSQSAVSAQIRNLEESLGVKLLEQIGRKMHLTRVGEELYLYSQKIFALIDEAIAETLRKSNLGA